MSQAIILLTILYAAYWTDASLLNARLVLQNTPPHRGNALKITHVQALKNTEHGHDVFAYAKASTVKGTVLTLGKTVGEYYTKVKLGSSLQELTVIIDTGSDLTWVQCAPCQGCVPSYDSARSSSYTKVSCGSPVCRNDSVGAHTYCEKTGTCAFASFYEDGSFSYGDISSDKLTIGSSSVESFLFGCAKVDLESNPTGASGILGLNTGSKSLLSQLGGGTYTKRFAHCFPDKIWNLNSAGVFFFGEPELPQELSYTSLTIQSSDPFFRTALAGISVGSQRVSLPAGSTAMVDSGTAFTQLLEPVYSRVRDVFLRERPQTLVLTESETQAGGFDTCFTGDISDYSHVLHALPKVVLQFRDGARLELPPIGLLLPVSRGSNGMKVCFAFQRGEKYNVIGNFQQQNVWVDYDVTRSRIGFAPASCVSD